MELQIGIYICRFLAFQNFRWTTRSVLASRKTNFSQVNSKGESYMLGFPYTMWRLYFWCKHSVAGSSPFLLPEVRQNLLNCSGCRNFGAYTASNAIPYHAQVAWNRFSQICLYNRPTLAPISRMARAVSVALVRSNLVVPRVIAFVIGELAWTHRTWAEAESLAIRDNMYSQALDDHVYLSALVLSLFEGLILLLRAVYLAVLFLPCIAMAPFADSLSNEFRKAWLHVVRLTLERAGPAFIKWGQWAATRPDLFPQDLCAELARLHAKAPSHSFSFTKMTIERAFGRKLHEIFANFEEEPVASGSVAQVHRATLKYRYPGKEIEPIIVAVKVRHPSVAEAIRRDFVLINFVAKISKLIPTLKWSRLEESIQQFAVFMISQVDLAREAAHLSRFIYNFRKWKDVSFPRPLYPLVHPAVLVETYEQGKSVLHYVDELDGDKRIRSALAHIGTQALLKMLLIDNFIHADMHPGNILVRLTDENISHKQLLGSRPQVIFLDVGMTAELSKRDRHNVIEFFKAVALLDGRTAAECILRLSKQQKCPDPKAFIEEVENCYNSWRSPNEVNPAECIQQLLEHVRRHKVNIDGDICIVMVTTLVLEGWQQKLDPEYNESRGDFSKAKSGNLSLISM
ncbi:probable serine/threonine-protein kinase abkC isoform X2 [Jatropha curcas]|uniref:probable serine/threonine-protein kinase abkC isoform X2 n=1 Tax=Jatropha curcas TaxID=180498 RepID=UPI0009D70B7D|nr:probable serine/threonine-protein kinase abkC isoform X2 [Jatropha curcas]